jgi:polyhydroxybutyrate depolymerase
MPGLPRVLDLRRRWRTSPPRGARGRSGAVVVAVLAVALSLVAVPGWSSEARAEETAAAADVFMPRTTGCYGRATRNDCTERIELSADGRMRAAYVYRPPAAATRTVPMVVVVHGLRQSPRIIDDMAGWTRLARREGFAVTFPLGYWTEPETYGYQASWNAGTCCGPASERWDAVDDTALMEALVEAAATVYPGNGKVYYAGFSNGAMLGYRLQCEDAGAFRAIVAVHGAVTTPTCRPEEPRPFLAIHALRDTIVPYGGCTLRQAGTSCRTRLHADLVPGRTTVAELRAAAGCTGVWARRYAPHTTIATATGCREPGIVHMTIDNAGHDWVTDARRYGIDETEVAWQFLRTK